MSQLNRITSVCAAFAVLAHRQVLSSAALASLVVLAAGPLQAQTSKPASFEGEIVYSFEAGPRADTQSESDLKDLRILSNADRILIRPTRVDEQGRQDNDALLLRNDLRDIVLLTDGNEAVRMTESELSYFAQMLNSFSAMMGSANDAASALDALMGGGSSQPAKPEWLKTDEKKSFHGIRSVKWRLRQPDKDGWVDLWLAESERLDWGLISGDWSSLSSSVSGVEFDPAPILRNGSFPLVLEVYEKRELVWKMTASEVKRRAISSTQLDIPEGRQVIGLSELLMKMMSGG